MTATAAYPDPLNTTFSRPPAPPEPRADPEAAPPLPAPLPRTGHRPARARRHHDAARPIGAAAAVTPRPVTVRPPT